MRTFALISEGQTDQVVLDRIIQLTCENCISDGLEVNFLQPLRDESDTAVSKFGGWELVLEYCRLRFDDALESNDYVVVHIDTDAGEHPNFGLALTNNGVDRNHEDILADARNILVKNIGETKFRNVKERVIFAVSIHSIESWILLCLFNRDEPKGSFNRLNRHLVRANEPSLVKEVRRYTLLSRDIKARHLRQVRKMSGSLPSFLLDLEAACQV